MIDQPFWDGLAQSRLDLSACGACATWIWPPQWRCGHCGSWDIVWRPVAPTGTVHSLTRTHHAFVPAMVGRTPLITVLVELPQAGGARLLGQVTGEATGMVIGSRVAGVIEPATPTDATPVLRWRLAEEGA